MDTASYAFLRGALNNSHLPPKDTVRVEELINYFDYDYPLPADRSVPFAPTPAVLSTPWNPDTLLLHIGIKGFEPLPYKRPRANLVFLIDVSGSMNMPDKLPDADTSRLIEVPVDDWVLYRQLRQAPAEACFSAAVAAFGQLLRDDPRMEDYSYEDVAALAEPVRGRDRFGYRSEFLNLVRLAQTARSMGGR